VSDAHTGHFLRRYADAREAMAERSRDAVSPEQGLSSVAFAALAISLGCPVNRVSDLYSHMLGEGLPRSPGDAVDQFTVAIREVTGRIAP
jgi:hypothetical protein